MLVELTSASSHSHAAAPQLHAGLISFAIVQLGLGAFMAIAPHAFFETVGPFGAANDHYVRDMSTCYLAIGIGLAASLRYASWRAPMLGVSTVQFALHSVNHLIDIGHAHPAFVGYVDFAALTVATVQLAQLWRLAARAEARAGAQVLAPLAPTPERSTS